MSNPKDKSPAPAPPAGSGFILIKEKDGDKSMHRFDSEAELIAHLEAMWRYTGWHLVSVCKQ